MNHFYESLVVLGSSCDYLYLRIASFILFRARPTFISPCPFDRPVIDRPTGQPLPDHDHDRNVEHEILDDICCRVRMALEFFEIPGAASP